MTDRTFLDTNVLVYAIDDAEPVKRDLARRALGSTEYGELVVSTQILSEFYVTVTRKLAEPLPEAKAAEALDWLCCRWSPSTQRSSNGRCRSAARRGSPTGMAW